MIEGQGDNLPKLVEIMQRLLAPDGCPWDREQTLESLRPYVVEEAFEVVDAIDRGSPQMLKEELGDLLLQIVFQAELARTKGWFGPNDVVTAVCEKLIRRHPHVFADAGVSSAGGAVDQWERLKKAEKAGRGALEGVPLALPALLRAVRVGEKASSVGYDWPDAGGPRAKIDEELHELDQALADADLDDTGEPPPRDLSVSKTPGGVSFDLDNVEAELGDLLFSISSFARKLGLDPEAALRRSLDRFSRRFGHAEQVARERGQSLESLSPAELDELWDAAKQR